MSMMLMKTLWVIISPRTCGAKNAAIKLNRKAPKINKGVKEITRTLRQRQCLCNDADCQNCQGIL